MTQFEEFHALLKDGGRMAHSTRCYDYKDSSSRFHSLFLMERSPHTLAERTGFRVTDTTRDGIYINFVFERV